MNVPFSLNLNSNHCTAWGSDIALRSITQPFNQIFIFIDAVFSRCYGIGSQGGFITQTSYILPSTSWPTQILKSVSCNSGCVM